MSGANAVLLKAAVILVAAHAFHDDPEEDDDAEPGEDDDFDEDDEEEHDHDVYDAIRGPVERDAGHDQEVDEGGAPVPLWDDSWPTSLRDLSSVNGGAS